MLNSNMFELIILFFLFHLNHMDNYLLSRCMVSCIVLQNDSMCGTVLFDLEMRYDLSMYTFICEFSSKTM